MGHMGTVDVVGWRTVEECENEGRIRWINM